MCLVGLPTKLSESLKSKWPSTRVQMEQNPRFGVCWKSYRCPLDVHGWTSDQSLSGQCTHWTSARTMEARLELSPLECRKSDQDLPGVQRTSDRLTLIKRPVGRPTDSAAQTSAGLLWIVDSFVGFAKFYKDWPNSVRQIIKRVTGLCKFAANNASYLLFRGFFDRL